MAVVTAFATTPGAARHVPNPTEGILAPVFNSKNWAIFFSNNNQHNGWLESGLSWMQFMYL